MMPEQRLDPPDPPFVTASGCRHEVYATDEDEHGHPTNFLIDWFMGGRWKTICLNCFLKEFSKLSYEEQITFKGTAYTEVR